MCIFTYSNLRAKFGECFGKVNILTLWLTRIFFVFNLWNLNRFIFRIRLQINRIDDSLTRSGTIVTRKANLITSKQIFIVTFWRNLFQFILNDKLVHTVLGIERQVGTTLIEKDTELFAGLDSTIHHQLLVLGNVAIWQTDVAQLVVVSGRPSEGFRLRIPSRVGVGWRLKGGMHLLGLRIRADYSHYHQQQECQKRLCNLFHHKILFK